MSLRELQLVLPPPNEPKNALTSDEIRVAEEAIGLHLPAARHGILAAVDVARGRLAHARAPREVLERHFNRSPAECREIAERREDR